jgi:hypothetical protein
LKTHEQAAEQLSEILEQKTESAEVIEVFNQLVYHREQIEILKGQINYYEEAAALSAITCVSLPKRPCSRSRSPAGVPPAWRAMRSRR